MENILLVFGGESYEHDISVVTASQIYNKTYFEEKKLIPFYISREGKYYIYNCKEFDISDFSKEKFTKSNKKLKEVAFVSNEKNIVFVKSKFGLREYLKTDIAIIACHGGNGENGKLEAILDSVNISHSAGNIDSLAVCMNKYFFKKIMYGLKIPVVNGLIIRKKDLIDEDNFRNRVEKLGYPLVLKPNNGGSSIGLFVVKNFEELKNKIEDVFEFDNEVLVEKFIQNTREFNVAVIGNVDDYIISEVDEPLKENEVLSFADKYCQDSTGKFSKCNSGCKGSMESGSRTFPADINLRLKNRLQKLTYKIFTSLNLRGVVRIDYLYDEENNKLYVCEVNAIPGSLAYYFFSKGDILINDFVNKLINLTKIYKNSKFLINKEFFTDILK